MLHILPITFYQSISTEKLKKVVFVHKLLNMTENLKLGYCCMNTSLRRLGILCSRTCRLQTIKENGLQHAYHLANLNLRDLLVIIRWNYSHNIQCFRMSSDMFPFATHPEFRNQYDLSQFTSTLECIGALAKKYRQTLTFHPSQFNQLSSEKYSVVDNTIHELNFHAKIMDMMNLDHNSIIIIHGGSTQGGKDVALSRFSSNFKLLTPSTQSRLVVENCELAYSIEDLLPISRQLQLPIVIDFHHNAINPSTLAPLNHLITQVLEIWDKRGITPLFHVSDSRFGVSSTDSSTKRRAHSCFVQTLPPELLQLSVHRKVHVDVEAKTKEQAVFILQNSLLQSDFTFL